MIEFAMSLMFLSFGFCAVCIGIAAVAATIFDKDNKND